MRIRKEQPICPKCSSKNIMARVVQKDFYCRRCGFTSGQRKLFFRRSRRQTRRVKAKVGLTD